ncbi:MAG: apolipoprotein N-acyltransferase, partial [Gemmatimonadetes bacterium]|nr:apolipoprotein N-acyltransferase [Gemmatimonadota bacterium]
YVLADYPVLIQIARIGGVALVSFAVVLANALVAESMLALVQRRNRRVLGCLAGAILVVAALGIDGVTTIRTGASESPRTMRVAAVQPNIDAEEKWTPAFKSKAIDILMDLTREAAGANGEPPDLAVWPETSVPVYVRQEYLYYRRLVQFVREVDLSVLFGFPNAEYDQERGEYVYFNAGLLLAPDGTEAGEYRKMHLVPFGERLPLEDRFEWIANLDLGQANFAPGTEAKVMGAAGTGYFGTTICFEAIFPAVCRPFVLNGAEYLVNLTNDAWFGMTAAPSQHADMARFRAIELGVPFVRSANTGISFICDSFGRVLSQVPLGESGVAVATISPSRRTTFYRTYGEWFPRSVLAGTVLLGALAAFRGRKL